jgi:hypothetical protein
MGRTAAGNTAAFVARTERSARNPGSSWRIKTRCKLYAGYRMDAQKSISRM